MPLLFSLCRISRGLRGNRYIEHQPNNSYAISNRCVSVNSHRCGLQQQQGHQRGHGCNKKAYENIYNDQYEGGERWGGQGAARGGLVDANHVFRGIVFFFAARFSRDRGGVKLRINALGSHIVNFATTKKRTGPECSPAVSEETEKVEGALSGKATPSFFTPRRERYFPLSLTALQVASGIAFPSEKPARRNFNVQTHQPRVSNHDYQ